MIDFRYHLVSIVAVFLALAIGIVLGTSTFRGPVIQRVKNVAETLTKENDQLRAEVTSLRQQVEADQELVREIAPGLVDEQLQGERVVIVETPGTSAEMRSKIVGIVDQADATVDGRVSVRSKYLDDGEARVLGELASRLKPSGMELAKGSPYERSGAVLASALMDGGEGAADQGGEQPGGQSDGDQSEGDQSGEGAQDATALSGFETGGFITASGDPTGHATLAIVIAPTTPYDGEGAARDNQALAALARALDHRGGGTVVGGPPAATKDGGLIKAVRGSEASEAVSTVDFADTATGRVATVLALSRESRGESGHYGIGPGADAHLPSVAPSPSSTSAKQ